jgi:triosephosphate isomerase
MSLKEKLVIGNWKMNVLPSQAVSLVREILELSPSGFKPVIAPPFTHISLIKNSILSGFSMAAQDCHQEKTGAFTSEISPLMLKDLGVEYVILGHSEVRNSNPKEDLRLNLKIHSAIDSELKVIYCCGEPLSVREEGEPWEFIRNQIVRDISTLKTKDLCKLAIAYEPIWAIGTGLNANADQISEIMGNIRQWLTHHFKDDQSADQVPLLYGGSVKGNNASDIAQTPFVNGVLVGGASLLPIEFGQIMRAFQ